MYGNHWKSRRAQFPCFGNIPRIPHVSNKGGAMLFQRFSIYPHIHAIYFSSLFPPNLICTTSYLVLAAGHSKGIDKVHAFQMIGVCMVTWFTVYCKGRVPACPNGYSRTEFRMFRWKNVRWSSYEIYSWWVVTSQYICWRVFRDKRVAEHAQYKWGNHPTWGSPVHIPNMGLKMNRSNTKPGFPGRRCSRFYGPFVLLRCAIPSEAFSAAVRIAGGKA